MKSFIISLNQPISFWILSICFAAFLAGCAVEAKRESPLVFGYGITTMPGWQLKNSKTSLHAVLGYSRFNFKMAAAYQFFSVWGSGEAVI